MVIRDENALLPPAATEWSRLLHDARSRRIHYVAAGKTSGAACGLRLLKLLYLFFSTFLRFYSLKEPTLHLLWSHGGVFRL